MECQTATITFLLTQIKRQERILTEMDKTMNLTEMMTTTELQTLTTIFQLDPTEDTDTDGDGTGDNADTDDDGDGWSDAEEIVEGTDPLDDNSKPIDTDGDGIGNVADTDDDGDELLDINDNFPLNAQQSQTITWDNTTSRNLSGGAFSLGALASSGLALTYTSSNTSIATVNSNGLVTPLAGGAFTITISAPANASHFAASLTTDSITVIDDVTDTDDDGIPDFFDPHPNQQDQTITWDNTTSRNLSGGAFSLGALASSGLALTYTSSDTSIATVNSSGLVTPLAGGAFTITMSAPANADFHEASLTTDSITVIDDVTDTDDDGIPDFFDPHPNQQDQTITWDNTTSRNLSGGAFSLGALASSGLALTYTSSDTSIATVNSSGLVTPLAGGAFTITMSAPANADFHEASLTTDSITVIDDVTDTDDDGIPDFFDPHPNQQDQTITWDNTTSRNLSGGAFSLGALASSGLALTYTSSDTSIATVNSSGLVTPLAGGAFTITMSAPANADFHEASLTTDSITVIDDVTDTDDDGIPDFFDPHPNQQDQTITWDNTTSRNLSGGAFSLGALASSGLALTYTSSDTSIATVNSSGLVTPLAGGAFTITMSAPANADFHEASLTTDSITVIDDVQKVQRITYNGQTSHDLNDGPFSLGAYSYDPSKFTNRETGLTLSYVSNDTSIATVDVNGSITPLRGGTFTITISAPANASYFAASLTTASITVTRNANLSPTVELEMLWVEPGTFTMGAPTSEFGLNKNGETQHQVTLTKGFYLGKLEVTQAQYETVMTGNSDGLSATPSAFSGADRPVEQVSHDDIQIFLSRLNAQQSANIPVGWSYVLPTESQWEYACRAGTTTAYSWGNTLGDANGFGTYNHSAGIWTGPANYNGLMRNQTWDAGFRGAGASANPWGFFDMHGNVEEWTADWFEEHTADAQTDPKGPPGPVGHTSQHGRVTKGGNYGLPNYLVRSGARLIRDPSGISGGIGFRVALVPKQLQTIAWNNNTSHNLSDGPFSLGASTDSGVTLSYTSSDTSIATVNSNGLVTPLAGGAFTITISAPGNADFREASLTTDSITVSVPHPATVVATADHTVTWNTGDQIMIPALNSDGTFYYATLEPNFDNLTSSDAHVAFAIEDAASNPHTQVGPFAAGKVAAPLNISRNNAVLTITQTVNGALPEGKTSIIHVQNGTQTTSGILTGSFSGGAPVPAIDNTRGLGDLVSTISLSANANLSASGVADNSIHQTMLSTQVDYRKLGFEILYKPKQTNSRIQVGVTIGGVEMWSVEDSTTGIETTLNNTLDSGFSSIMGQPTVDIENDWRVLRIVVPGTYDNQYGTGNTGNFVFHIGLSHETESGGGIEIATNRNNCPVLNSHYSVNPTSTNWDLYRSNANFDGQFTHGYYRSADNGLCNKVWFGAMGGSSNYIWDGNYYLGDNGQYDLNGHPYYRHESNNYIIRWSTIHNQFGIYNGSAPRLEPSQDAHQLQTTNATSSSDCVYKLNWEWNTNTYGAQTGTTSVKYSQTSTNATNTTPLSTSIWGKSKDINGNEEIDYSMYIAPVIGNTLLSTEESYGS